MKKITLALFFSVSSYNTSRATYGLARVSGRVSKNHRWEVLKEFMLASGMVWFLFYIDDLVNFLDAALEGTKSSNGGDC